MRRRMIMLLLAVVAGFALLGLWIMVGEAG